MENDTGEFTSGETDFDAAARRMRSKTARQLADIDRRPKPQKPFLMGNDLGILGWRNGIGLPRITSPPPFTKK